jgi:NitT/TauT family transport system substrate-binding protein
MLVTERTIRENPELVFKLVLAHAKATEYLRENKRVWLEKASGFGTPVEILEKASRNMELAWDMDESFVRKAGALGERMLELGVIEREPDYEKLFDLRFVKKVKNDLE